ncbi:MAG: acetyl ornithine aminotransferase family protein [Anaerolineae bacterium]
MSQSTNHDVATATAPEASGSLPGPKSAGLVARDEAAMSPSYTRPYPFAMERGVGVRAWDLDGNEFLDMTAGIAVTATGHSHPKVVRAVQQQAERFLHMSGTDFYYEPEVDVAERLIETTPGDFEKRVFLTNSGAEAVEGAIKMTRYATGRPGLIAFHGAFHGRTMGALSLTASKAIQRAGFAPLVPGVTHVPYPNPYRPPLGASPDDCGRAVIAYIENEVFARTQPASEVAAVFVEALQGEGGYITPPDDFLPGLREMCDRHGILLVVDEIQTGMGRTGRWWASEHVGVEPDVLLSAKGLASGLPLGAIVAKAEYMSWPPGSHGTTFGGNPVCCAASVATFEVIEEEGLLRNATEMGDRFRAGLHDLAARYEQIGDVRGLGLWVAAELITDPATKTPNPALRDEIVQRAYDHRLLLLGAGKSTLRLMPGLNIAAAEVDEALARLGDVFAEVV